MNEQDGLPGAGMEKTLASLSFTAQETPFHPLPPSQGSASHGSYSCWGTCYPPDSQTPRCCPGPEAQSQDL